MLAYGRVHDAPPIFFLEVALVFMPFVVIPGPARLLDHPSSRCACSAIARSSGSCCSSRWRCWRCSLPGSNPVTDVDAARAIEVVLSFNQLLHHTRLSVNPFLPSAWLAQTVLAWSDGLTRQGLFSFLLLLSYALMGLLIGFEVRPLLLLRQLDHRAEFARRAFSRSRPLPGGSVSANPSCSSASSTNLLRPWSQPAAALILKDARLFWRDPAQ